MAISYLAPPHDLCDTPSEERAFERSRRSTLLVRIADLAEEQFVLRDADWGSLYSYLIGHGEVIPVLLEAPDAIRRVFGEVRPMLDLIEEPEEEWTQLFLVVPSREPVPQALERLRRLDHAWFADAARRARFAINVTIESDV